MKLYVKFLLFAMVLAMMGPFLLKGDDGRPLVSLSEVFSDGDEFSQGFDKMFNLLKQFKQFGGKTVNQQSDDVEQQPSMEGKTKVHRWRDADGIWQFSDANTSGGDSEVVYFDPNTNILQFNDLEELKRLQAANKPAAAPQRKAAQKSEVPSGMPPITQAMETMQKAENVQQLIDDRYQKQQDYLNNM